MFGFYIAIYSACLGCLELPFLAGGWGIIP